MKTRRLTLFTPLLVTFLTAFSKSPQYILATSSKLYGPYEASDKTVKLSFSYKNNTSKFYYSVVDSIEITDITNTYTYYTYTSSEHDLFFNYTAYVLFPLNCFKQNSKLRLEIRTKDVDTNTNLFWHYTSCTVKQNTVINASDYTSKYYMPTKTVFYITDDTMKGSGYTEKYKFTGFKDTFSNSEYFTLDISDLNLDYVFYEKFNCIPTMRIYDPYACFPYIPSEDGTYRNIPLLYEQNDTTVQFSYPDLYVNPETFEMSLSERSGFIKTDKFYLPLKRRELLEGTKVKFTFEEFGCNKLTVNHEMTYFSDSNLFGNSSNSNYYIRGGVLDD